MKVVIEKINDLIFLRKYEFCENGIFDLGYLLIMQGYFVGYLNDYDYREIQFFFFLQGVLEYVVLMCMLWEYWVKGSVCISI